MNDIARAVMEHLQRASFNLKRNALPASLEAFCAGLELLLDRKGLIIGQDKIQLQTYIGQYLLGLSRRDDVKEYYYARKVYSAEHLARYKGGREEEFYKKVKDIRDDLDQGDQAREKIQETRREESLQELQARGMALLEENPAKGKVLLRKVAEASAQDPAVTGDIADAFIRRGLLLEAVALCQRILELNPGNPRMYSAAITACLAMKEFPQAEQWFIAVGKRFGLHPKTRLRMARMYLDWRKWEPAYEHARAAAADPDCAKEAKALLAEAEKRLM